MNIRKCQFGLRFIFLATVFSAVLLAVWIKRPSPTVTVQLKGDDDGVFVNDRRCPLPSLPIHLEDERNYRRRWFTDCQIDLKTIIGARHHGAKRFEMQEVKRVASELGIEIVNTAYTGTLPELKRATMDSHELKLIMESSPSGQELLKITDSLVLFMDKVPNVQHHFVVSGWTTSDNVRLLVGLFTDGTPTWATLKDGNSVMIKIDLLDEQARLEKETRILEQQNSR